MRQTLHRFVSPKGKLLRRRAAARTVTKAALPGVRIIAFLGLLAAIVWVAGRPTPLAQILAAILIVVVLFHAVTALGWTEAFAFVVICLIVSFSIENLGVLTGFPFGHYAFLVGAHLPRVGEIPIIVGPLYFGMGYPSWIIANLIAEGGVERPQTKLQLFAAPVIAAFVMVQWDVVMDPANSTLARAWAWHESGGYFGVPLSNFLGWFLTTYVYFQAFSFFLYRRRTKPPYPSRSANFWAVPVMLYLAAGFSQVPPLLDADARLIDANHHVWSAADLRETAVIVMLFTMLPTSLLALLRLRRPTRSD